MRTEYSFLTMNGSGVIDTVKLVKLPDEDAALRHARAMACARSIEIWASKRKVAIVPPLVDRRDDRRVSS